MDRKVVRTIAGSPIHDFNTDCLKGELGKIVFLAQMTKKDGL